MVQGMLVKYNLEMADVFEVKSGRMDLESVQFGTPWACSIAHNISKLYMCQYYAGRKVTSCKVAHHFVGLTANTATASIMSEWIINLVKREGAKLYGGDTTAGARAFGVGAASRIRQRVAEMLMPEAMAETSSCTALVVTSLYDKELEANKAFLSTTGITLSSKKVRKTLVDSSAFELERSSVIKSN